MSSAGRVWSGKRILSSSVLTSANDWSPKALMLDRFNRRLCRSFSQMNISTLSLVSLFLRLNGLDGIFPCRILLLLAVRHPPGGRHAAWGMPNVWCLPSLRYCRHADCLWVHWSAATNTHSPKRGDGFLSLNFSWGVCAWRNSMHMNDAHFSLIPFQSLAFPFVRRTRNWHETTQRAIRTEFSGEINSSHRHPAMKNEFTSFHTQNRNKQKKRNIYPRVSHFFFRPR